MALPLDYAFEVVDSRGDLADQSGMKTDFVLTITQVRKVELVRMSVVCLITPVQPDIYARVPSFLKLTYPSGDSVNAAIDPPGPNESIQNSTGLPFCTEDVPYSGR